MVRTTNLPKLNVCNILNCFYPKFWIISHVIQFVIKIKYINYLRNIKKKRKTCWHVNQTQTMLTHHLTRPSPPILQHIMRDIEKGTNRLSCIFGCSKTPRPLLIHFCSRSNTIYYILPYWKVIRNIQFASRVTQKKSYLMVTYSHEEQL